MSNTITNSLEDNGQKLDQFWEVTIQQSLTHKIRVKAVGRDNAKNKALHWLNLGLAKNPRQEVKVAANAAYDQWSEE